MNFAPNMTQVIVISLSRAAAAAMRDRNEMGVAVTPLQEHIFILGEDVDEKLRIDRHIKKICRIASPKVSAFRRLGHFLKSKRLMLLYKASTPRV